MKRRYFLFSLITSVVYGAKIIWAKKGFLGYTENSVSAKKSRKTCETCRHLFRDGVTKNAGICQLPQMKGAYVKYSGTCRMWQKES